MKWSFLLATTVASLSNEKLSTIIIKRIIHCQTAVEALQRLTEFSGLFLVNTAVVLINQASRARQTAIFVRLSCQLPRTDQLPCLVTSHDAPHVRCTCASRLFACRVPIHQSKRLYADNVKAKATRNEIR